MLYKLCQSFASVPVTFAGLQIKRKTNIQFQKQLLSEPVVIKMANGAVCSLLILPEPLPSPMPQAWPESEGVE